MWTIATKHCRTDARVTAILALVSLALAWSAAGCTPLITPVPAPAEAQPAGDIVAVQRQYEEQLMAIPGVVGVAVGACADEPCLKVLVAARTPELEQAIPDELEGFTVEIEETGVIQPQGDD